MAKIGVKTVIKKIVPGVSRRPKGLPMNPITKMKMANGVPGFKRGGDVKKGSK